MSDIQITETPTTMLAYDGTDLRAFAQIEKPGRWRLQRGTVVRYRRRRRAVRRSLFKLATAAKYAHLG